MFALLRRGLADVVRSGQLTVLLPGGRELKLGDGTGKPVTVKFNSRRAALKLVADSDLYLGEIYMDRELDMVDGTIYEFLEILMKNLEGRKAPWIVEAVYGVRKVIRRVKQYNPAAKSRRNVAHHYDLSGELYDLFLDRDRQYSCAYFEHDDDTLDAAQLAKKRHIAAKLQIEPGMRVLDIGSGWGGMALYLAEACRAKVTGITLSAEQLRVSRQRAEQRGVADLVNFELIDYRKLDGQYDRIVSVGMFEHVGVNHFSTYFNKVRALLNPGGVALIHSIGRSNGPGATSAWIERYIFPGGYIPALSEVLPFVEKSGLYLTDVEILRLHYAKTLREWAIRFQHQRERVKALYDERFCRMWEFYLAASELAFRHGGMNNFQIQLTRSQHALPLTRNYIQDREDALRGPDSERPGLKSVKPRRTGS